MHLDVKREPNNLVAKKLISKILISFIINDRTHFIYVPNPRSAERRITRRIKQLLV